MYQHLSIGFLIPKAKKPTPPGYPSAEEYPKYPDEVLKEFNENENFVSLTRDTRLIDYQNAQVILVGAREGKDAIKRDLGIDIEEKKEDSDIFNRLKMRNDQIPTRPRKEGKLE